LVNGRRLSTSQPTSGIGGGGGESSSQLLQTSRAANAAAIEEEGEAGEERRDVPGYTTGKHSQAEAEAAQTTQSPRGSQQPSQVLKWTLRA